MPGHACCSIFWSAKLHWRSVNRLGYRGMEVCIKDTGSANIGPTQGVTRWGLHKISTFWDWGLSHRWKLTVEPQKEAGASVPGAARDDAQPCQREARTSDLIIYFFTKKFYHSYWFSKILIGQQTEEIIDGAIKLGEFWKEEGQTLTCHLDTEEGRLECLIEKRCQAMS